MFRSFLEDISGYNVVKAIISNESAAESGELTWDCLVSLLNPRSVRK